MSELTAYVDGVSLIGPGLFDWPMAEAVLAGRSVYVPDQTRLPELKVLPAAERRRAGHIVQLAIATGLEAASRAGCDAATPATVFAASGGDGENCHAICETLATPLRQLSPTRFHNSVHNAAAGYWSIATGAMTASTALCAHDASFVAGLLEALTQVVVSGQAVLLIACDTVYPPPLHAKRPLLDAFGCGMLLAPARGERSLAKLSAELADAPADRCESPALESLRRQVPAARCLPLLARMARREPGVVVVEYLGELSLRTLVEPC